MKGMVVVIFGLVALAVVGACGGGGEIVPSPTPIPMATQAPPPSSGPTNIQKTLPPPHLGAGSPSVELRIYNSDVIVRASLLSSEGASLRFSVIEHLKGTGPSEITVNAISSLRDTNRDSREALLFLNRRGSDAAGSSGGEFIFTDSHSESNGYTIDTLDPAWLPVEMKANSSASGASNSSFITDSGKATGGSLETITLAELRSKIAWVDGEDGIEGYDECVVEALWYLKHYRDWEAHNGQAWTPSKLETSLVSGTVQGTAIYLTDTYRNMSGYHQIWITEDDADFFDAAIVDNDEVASNGYRRTVTTTRPLPKGVYEFNNHVRAYVYTHCDFYPENNKSIQVVNISAPGGTLHEAFFDPTESGEDEVSPASFSVGGTDTEITGLEWADGKVVLSLDPVVSLDGYTLDFIELDGMASLNLRGLDVVERSRAGDGSGTLKWAVADEPWEDGDKLMLRIREDGAAAPPLPQPSPRMGEGADGEILRRGASSE